MGLEEFSEEVLLHHSTKYPELTDIIDIGDPAGEQRSQNDAKTAFSILHGKGINIEGGMQTLVIRLESVRKPLRMLALKGEPSFLLDPDCKMLRKGFQGGYQYRRLQTSAERYTQKPDKNQYSHPMDALQYPMTRIFGGGLTDDRRRPGGYEGVDDTFSTADRNEVTGY
jgi:hypothetical protein